MLFFSIDAPPIIDSVTPLNRFLYAAVGASGSTHDARFLKSASIYSDIVNGLVIPDRKMALGNFKL